MKFPDAVLLAVPLAYLLVAATVASFDGSPFDAVVAGSLLALGIIGQALFVNPPR